MQRTFSVDDQQAFALLSGDHNPLHVDPVAARRLMFGGVVVHGMHTLLWALDRWAGNLPGPVALRHLKAVFPRPVGLGDEVRARVLDARENEAEIEVSTGSAVVTWIKLATASRREVTPSSVERGVPERRACRSLSAADLEAAEGSVALTLDPPAVRRLFPGLVDRLPDAQLATLLATTRVVGMECPGLHSVYSEVVLTFSPEETGEPVLRYRTRKYHPRYRLAFIDVEGPGAEGSLKAFLRPTPQEQAGYALVRSRVAPDAFRGQRAMVVGGSRGLGEVTAKLLAAGGADVVLTYHRGADDAERVRSEISSGGGRATAVEYDVLHPDAEVTARLEGAFAGAGATDLYYFATPFIDSSGKSSFSRPLFERFCDFYLFGLVRTVDLLAPQGLQRVFYPSSVFVDEVPAAFGEYAAAKAASEVLCRSLSKREPGIVGYAPRLPRMATDQVTGIMTAGGEDPAPVMLDHLLRFRDIGHP